MDPFSDESLFSAVADVRCKGVESGVLFDAFITLLESRFNSCFLSDAKLLVCMGDCGMHPLAGGKPKTPHNTVIKAHSKKS